MGARGAAAPLSLVALGSPASITYESGSHRPGGGIPNGIPRRSMADPVPYKRWSPPQGSLRQAPGWFTECPPLGVVGAAAHHPKIRKIHLLRHFTIRRRIRSQRVGLRWRPMGAPFHDAAQRPGGRFIGFRAGPRGAGSGTLSLEGGTPHNWGAEQGRYRLETVVRRAFAPNATTRPLPQNAPHQGDLNTRRGPVTHVSEWPGPFVSSVQATPSRARRHVTACAASPPL